MMKIYIIFFLLLNVTGFAQVGWVEQYYGNNYQFADMDVIDNNVIYAVGGISSLGGFVIKTSNGGNSWDSVLTTPGGFHVTSISFLNELTGYVTSGSQGTKIYYTQNGGINWIIYDTNLGDGTLTIFSVNQDTSYFIRGVGGDGIYRTTNGGMNWGNFGFISSNAKHDFFFTNSKIGWTCGDNGIITKTTNACETWSFANTNTLKHLYDVYFMNEMTGWCSGRGRKVIKTTDGGMNWVTARNDTLYDHSLFSVLYNVFFINDNTGWTSTMDTVFYTSNGGVNWLKQIPDLNSHYYRTIEFINENTGWLIGSDMIFKTTTGGNPIGIQPISNEIPNQFRLSQNYPNPFNPVTNIDFDIKNTSYAKLYLYDLLGRTVEILVNEELKAGSYKVAFDGSKLSSGIYYYTLTTDKYTETKKMILIK